MAHRPTLADELKQVALSAGVDAVGITTAEPFEDTRRHLEERKADGLHGGMQFTFRNPARSTDPSRALAGARSLVVAARSYRRADDDAAGTGGPRAAVARYSWEDHYRPLRDALDQVVVRLERHGHQAKVLVDDNALVDRAAAHRAGLGWFGKNTNLLLPERGSWFVLGSVVTTAELPPDPGPIEDGCGPCERCITACPTGAIVAPGVLDARRCLAWLLEAAGPFPREHREALGGRIYGCDDCQEVCPPNKLEIRRRPAAPAAADAQPWVDLVELLDAADDELVRRYGRWYIPQRDPRYLRRNALVALGNVGDGRDARVERVLTNALADPDPLVRSHAVWAAARLGRHDLLAPLHAADQADEVRLELELAGAAPGR